MLRNLWVLPFAILTVGTAQPTRQGFDMEAPHPPRAVAIGGHRLLVYELHLTNFADTDLHLTRIEALDVTTGAVIASLEGSALYRAIGGPGRKPGPATAKPGQRLVVYWEISLPLADPIPRRLRHRLVFDGASTCGGDVAPAREPLPLLGPPLRGGPWAAVYDPALERGHRRMVYAVDGIAHVPGRHAIDWFRAGGGDGRGADVLAVADATVAATRDDMDEPVAGVVARPVPLADGTGNFVALRLADGSFAVYEHLARGVRVKPGQKVQRGDVIARLGATGHASKPHLHFHVADATSSLASEGLPFRLSGMTMLGHYPSVFAAADGGAWAAESPKRLSAPLDDMPAPNIIIRFD